MLAAMGTMSSTTSVSDHGMNPSRPPDPSNNPILDGWYADPESAFFEDRYWIFPTFSAPFPEQLHLDAFSSADLVTWEKHPRVLEAKAVSWLRKALWAPVAVQSEGKYYLFFSGNDIQTPESPWWKPEDAFEPEVGGIGVGVATAPEGPYRDLLGEPLIGEVVNSAQPIDPCLFQDENGDWLMAYGGWGHCNLVRLAPDFRSLVPFPDGATAKEITPPGYVEGPFFFRRGDQWYFLWSVGNWTDGSYAVRYGRSSSLMGPWKPEGTVLENDPTVANGAGHCSVLRRPGTDDYLIFYHRRPLDNRSPHHRVVCVDRLRFAPDGSILPVAMTDRDDAD